MDLRTHHSHKVDALSMLAGYPDHGEVRTFGSAIHCHVAVQICQNPRIVLRKALFSERLYRRRCTLTFADTITFAARSRSSPRSLSFCTG
jgi:hypothetical protein